MRLVLVPALLIALKVTLFSSALSADDVAGAEERARAEAERQTAAEVREVLLESERQKHAEIARLEQEQQALRERVAATAEEERHRREVAEARRVQAEARDRRKAEQEERTRLHEMEFRNTNSQPPPKLLSCFSCFEMKSRK